MSDLHLMKDGVPVWDTNTMDHFNKSIEIIRGMNNIDAIIVTGDLSNDGSRWPHLGKCHFNNDKLERNRITETSDIVVNATFA